jgi:hypothetical protein
MAELFLEVLDGCDRRQRRAWHVDNGSNSAAGRGHRSVRKILTLFESGGIEMNMGIYCAGEHVKARCIDDLLAFVRFDPVSRLNYPAVRYADVGTDKSLLSRQGKQTTFDDHNSPR